MEEATSLREELNSHLSKACMLLRKWRSSSPQLLETIPPELRERDESTLAVTPSDYPKTLGVHWNTQTDTLHIHTPKLTYLNTPTKREVASAVGQTFDVLGWFAPATIQVKILLQHGASGLGGTSASLLNSNQFGTNGHQSYTCSPLILSPVATLTTTPPS